MTRESKLEQPVTFAFLRAVNLGKYNKVPMAELMKAMARAGLPPAAYLLASGNVVLSADMRSASDAKGLLVDLISSEFGVDTKIVLRDADGLRDLIATDPFTSAGMEHVYVSLWDETPDEDGLTTLAAEDFAPDALHIVPGAAFMGYPATSHESRLSNALVEKRLKVAATARNVNTLRRLLERFAD